MHPVTQEPCPEASEWALTWRKSEDRRRDADFPSGTIGRALESTCAQRPPPEPRKNRKRKREPLKQILQLKHLLQSTTTLDLPDRGEGELLLLKEIVRIPQGIRKKTEKKSTIPRLIRKHMTRWERLPNFFHHVMT